MMAVMDGVVFAPKLALLGQIGLLDGTQLTMENRHSAGRFHFLRVRNINNAECWTCQDSVIPWSKWQALVIAKDVLSSPVIHDLPQMGL